MRAWRGVTMMGRLRTTPSRTSSASDSAGYAASDHLVSSSPGVGDLGDRREVGRIALVEKRRVDHSRAHHAHPHAVGGALHAQARAQSDHAVLGHGVGRQHGRREQARQRRRVHDVATALSDHDGVGGHHAVHDAAQVDVDGAVPVGQGELAHLSGDPHAGVVEQQVEMPVVVGGALAPARRRRRRRSRRAPRPTTRPGGPAAKCVGGRFGPGLVDVGQHHRGPTARQRARQRLADPRRRPGDDGHLPSEVRVGRHGARA